MSQFKLEMRVIGNQFFLVKKGPINFRQNTLYINQVLLIHQVYNKIKNKLLLENTVL